MTRATARVLAASVRSANSGLAFQWPANLRFHASIWAKVRPSGEGCRTGFTSTKRPYETAATTVAARMARATASPPSRDALPAPQMPNVLDRGPVAARRGGDALQVAEREVGGAQPRAERPEGPAPVSLLEHGGLHAPSEHHVTDEE